MKKQALIILSAMLLAACQAGVMVRSENSSDYYRVTEVKLLQPLTVSADNTRVFIQDGRVIPVFGSTDQYRPQCAFELRDRMESEQIIRPGSFNVTRVQGLMNEVVLWKPLQVVSLSLAGMDDGAPMVHEGYHFWLEQNEQGVMRMSCYGVFADMPEVEPPTMEEIRRALGEVAELNLQQSSN